MRALIMRRSAQADTALLAFQVRPAAHQPGRQVTQLCQLHLQLAFEGTCPLREDVEDQAGAPQHPARQHAFEVAFLAGTQRVVEDHHVGLVFVHRGQDLSGLALADEQARFRYRACRCNRGSRGRAGGAHQLGEFLQIFLPGSLGKINVDQNGPFTGLRAFEQTTSPS
jgi:hypothetical protein